MDRAAFHRRCARRPTRDWSTWIPSRCTASASSSANRIQAPESTSRSDGCAASLVTGCCGSWLLPRRSLGGDPRELCFEEQRRDLGTEREIVVCTECLATQPTLGVDQDRGRRA